jgi:hypothetical protein
VDEQSPTIVAPGRSRAIVGIRKRRPWIFGGQPEEAVRV